MSNNNAGQKKTTAAIPVTVAIICAIVWLPVAPGFVVALLVVALLVGLLAAAVK